MPSFKEQLDQDLSAVFMNPDEFADQIKIIPLANPSGEYFINGIFDKEFFAVDPDTQADIISAQPNVRIKESDLQNPIEPGDKAVIKNITYGIIRPETDGVGTTTLFLHVTA